MKCPRCGSEMVLDSHRKIPLNMCYECGFIEGRSLEDEPPIRNNYMALKEQNLDGTVLILSKLLQRHGIQTEPQSVYDWLLEEAK